MVDNCLIDIASVSHACRKQFIGLVAIDFSKIGLDGEPRVNPTLTRDYLKEPLSELSTSFTSSFSTNTEAIKDLVRDPLTAYRDTAYAFIRVSFDGIDASEIIKNLVDSVVEFSTFDIINFSFLPPEFPFFQDREYLALHDLCGEFQFGLPLLIHNSS